MTWIKKGFTKENHPSVRKISDTMKARKIDNFRKWRMEHAVTYNILKKDGDLAELIGAVLGDGHIQKFPRTERLTITGDAKKLEFLIRYSNIVERLFGKVPTVEASKTSNAVRISLYQKIISERLDVPTGNRKGFAYKLPEWIKNNDEYLLRFLRGLFEAEASLSIHLPTCTYNFSFSNLNKHLLDIVELALIHLEFHPERRYNAIRIRRRAEVKKLKELMHFREY